MKLKWTIKKEHLLNGLLFLAAILTSFLFPNKYIISFWILFFSLWMMMKVADSSHLMILFGTIAYINISLVISEILNIATALAPNTMIWQRTIRLSDIWLIGALSLVIMLGTLNLFVDKDFAKLTKNGFEIEFKNNAIIFYFGYIVILIIWAFFGYESKASTYYVSNTSTIYEYCLAIVPILWFYSGNKKHRKYLLAIFVVLYCTKSMLHGDRSSMIPMLIFFYFLCYNRIYIDFKKIILLAVAGIILSNIISVYRTLEGQGLAALTSNFLEQYGATFFTSDTVSQSYYTSVVIQLTHFKVNNPFLFFFDFIVGIFLGGDFGNANVNKVVLQYYMNKSGGFYYSWFYFWLGNFGVFLGSVVLGSIIRRIYTQNSNYFNLLKYIVVIFSFRWYLYTPFVFYRSVLFVFSAMYFICWIFDTLLHFKNYSSYYCLKRKRKRIG